MLNILPQHMIVSVRLEWLNSQEWALSSSCSSRLDFFHPYLKSNLYKQSSEDVQETKNLLRSMICMKNYQLSVPIFMVISQTVSKSSRPINKQTKIHFFIYRHNIIYIWSHSHENWAECLQYKAYIIKNTLLSLLFWAFVTRFLSTALVLIWGFHKLLYIHP